MLLRTGQVSPAPSRTPSSVWAASRPGREGSLHPPSLCPLSPSPCLGPGTRAPVCTFYLWRGPSVPKQRGRNSLRTELPGDRTPRETSPSREMWLTSFRLFDFPSAPPIGNNAEVCLLPPEVGPCRARIPSFYYDRYTQSCRQFMYGGCEGNANNFDSPEACEEACWKIESKSRRVHMEPWRCGRAGSNLANFLHPTSYRKF